MVNRVIPTRVRVMRQECFGVQREHASVQVILHGMQQLKIVVAVLSKFGLVFDARVMVVMVIHAIQFHVDQHSHAIQLSIKLTQRIK